jgi:vancomycin resistance protein YoaR
MPLKEERRVVLPIVRLLPTVTAETARDLGIRELVVEGSTSFRGSSDARIQNIATATARFHGVVIGPGELFSFNEHLGDVSAEEGYEESLIIMGDRTLVGIGGGVCQVATTAFRAAFWGGYPVEERWPHGYRVRAYEPPLGLDATVYAPYVDLKFRNDTPYSLLVQTEADVDTGTLTFRFYGTSTGRRIEMEEPRVENRVPHGPPIYEDDPALLVGTRKQVDWEVDGLDVTVVRRVWQDQELAREDTFFSRYEPWQARYRVGTRPIMDEGSDTSATPPGDLPH